MLAPCPHEWVLNSSKISSKIAGSAKNASSFSVMRYVIIGNSAAGIFAAEAIRRHDRNGRITIISDEDGPAYSRCLIPHYLSGKMSAQDLVIRPESWYRELGIQTRFASKAVLLSLPQKTVLVNDGSEIPYDSLLLATGASPTIPPIQQINLKGVFTIRKKDDAENIKNHLARTKHCVILGAGFIGLKMAEALSWLKIQVTVVEALGRVLPAMTDDSAAQIFSNVMSQRGINLIVNTSVVEVVGDEKGFVREVALSNGSTLPAEMLIVAAGVRPNIALAREAGIRVNRGIVIDETMRTNIEDIYAAGDAAESPNILSGKTEPALIWPAAAEQGEIAGMNMARVQKKYPGWIAMNSLVFLGIPLISFGITEGPGNDYESISRMSRSGRKYRKIILENDRLAGLISVGEPASEGELLSFLKCGKRLSRNSGRDTRRIIEAWVLNTGN